MEEETKGQPERKEPWDLVRFRLKVNQAIHLQQPLPVLLRSY